MSRETKNSVQGMGGAPRAAPDKRECNSSKTSNVNFIEHCNPGSFCISDLLIEEAREAIHGLAQCVCGAIGCKANKRFCNILFRHADQGFSITHKGTETAAVFVSIHDMLYAISPGSTSSNSP